MVETICDQLITFRFLSTRLTKAGQRCLESGILSVTCFVDTSAILANALEMGGSQLPIWVQPFPALQLRL